MPKPKTVNIDEVEGKPFPLFTFQLIGRRVTHVIDR